MAYARPRDIPAPSYGDPLYGEVELVQIASVNDAGKLFKMYEWQMSPKLSGHGGNPHTSLGRRTLTEWKNIKKRFASSSPNNNKPVTLTLIRTSNDYDPTHLVKHHRVVAYGYEERALYDGEYVHGRTNTKIKHVRLYIYDPNHPYIYDPDHMNDDDVYLSFYTNCDDDWISLKHSKGDKAAGFFMDDIPRAYSSDELPDLQIQKIELTEITSESRAQFDLQFRWECRVIPYFSIQIDGIDWQDNEGVMENYLPEGDIKQCPTKSGDMTVNLDLPRETSTVSVRFLDDESYTAWENVSVGEPTFRCSPYYWGQNEPIKEQDFYFKDKDPSASALNQLSNPDFAHHPCTFSSGMGVL